MKLIADWTTKQCRCHICGTTKSVKYLMNVYDPVVDNKPVEVAVCNKCALLHAELQQIQKRLSNTQQYIGEVGR